MTRTPDFILLGQGKAGSSLIYRVLNDNPQIGLSIPKEVHYFVQHFDKGPKWYADHFAHIPPETARVGEISPSYLTTEAVDRIAATLGQDIKVVFVLRRPIERLYARYLQNICAKRKPGGFHGPIRSLTKHCEEVHSTIRRAYELFGSDNVLPLMFETDVAVANPTYEAKILAHIGLPDAGIASKYAAKPVNPTVFPRFISTGDKSLITFHRGKRYVIPKHRLVFCAQDRNSQIIKNPTQDQILEAQYLQASWSSFVSTEEYAAMQEDTVFPFADALEAEFGLNVDHWRTPARQIMYAPAPPPAALQKDRPQ